MGQVGQVLCGFEGDSYRLFEAFNQDLFITDESK